MICRLLANGKRVGITANSHKVIGNLLQGGLQGCRIHRRRPGRPARRPRPDPGGRAGDPRQGPRATRAQLDAGLANLAAGTSWLWASERWPVRSTFFRRRGRADVARERRVDGARGAQLRAPRRSQQLDQPLHGTRRPARTVRRSHTCSTGPRRSLRTVACSSRRRGGSIRTLAAFTSEVFYDDRLEAGATLVVQRLIGDDPADGVARASPRPERGVRLQFADRGRGGVAALAHAIVDGGRWIDDERNERDSPGTTS